MKKLLIVLTLSIILLLSSCYNQKYKSLESENKQLRQQVDSLSILLKKQKLMTDMQKILADSAMVEAMQQQEEAQLQRKIADSARNVNIKTAMEAKMAKEKALKQAKSVQK